MVKICATCGQKTSSILGHFELKDGTVLCESCKEMYNNFKYTYGKDTDKILIKIREQKKLEEGHREERLIKRLEEENFEEGRQTRNKFTRGNYVPSASLSASGILYFFGFFSSIICIIAGLWMLSIAADIDSIMLEFYHACGLFVIGFGLFVGALLYGLAKRK